MPFRAKGIPTVLQIEDYQDEGNPYMHKSGDTLATLNLDFWLEQMKTTIAIAAHLAEPLDEPPVFVYQVFLPAVFFNSVRAPALRWRLQSPGRMTPAG